MIGITASIKRHLVLTYVAVTFAISWGGILLVVAPGGVTPTAEHLVTLITLAYVGLLAAPSLTGLLLTSLVAGRSGLRALLARLLRWRVSGRWYAAALLTAPISILAALFALSLVSPTFLPRLLVEEDRAELLRFSVVAGLLVGVFQELGWTGFVVPALRRRHGVLVTGLIVGLLFAAWNFLIVYLREVSLPTPGTLTLFIYLPAALFTWQVAYRVLLVWLYDRTNSLLLAMLMATSLVVWWTSLTPLALTRETLVVFYLVLTAVWCAAAAVVVLGNRRQPRVTTAPAPGGLKGGTV